LEGLLKFFLMVVLISASGALAPGPLLVATMNISLKAGKYAGFITALGHMVFELPLIIVIRLGMWSFIDDPIVKLTIGIVGGAGLMAFGILQIRSSIREIRSRDGVMEKNLSSRFMLGKSRLLTAFLIGFFFTALNPYFLVWWFTAGLILISEAIKLDAVIGIFIMFIFHIWLDYAWLGAAGYTTATGARFLGPRLINLLSLALAIIIVVLGADILRSTLINL